MNVIGYILGLAWMILSGYFVLRLISPSSKIFYRFEFFNYSFLVGLILVPVLLFIGGLINIPLNVWAMNGILMIFSFILGILVHFYAQPILFENGDWLESFKKLSLWKKFAFTVVWIWIATKLIIGGIDIIGTPTYADDAFANWNIRAKTWFYAENLVLDSANPRFLGGGYKQYPPTVPIAKTYFTKLFGSWNEGVANSFSLLVYLSVCIVLFFALYRESGSVVLGSIGAYAVTSIPLLHIHGTNPYFDLFMALYFFIAVYFLYLFLQKRIDYKLPLLFSGLLVYTKSEGLIIFLTTVIVCLWVFVGIQMYKKDKSFIMPAVKITLGALLIGLPFILFKLAYGLGFGNGNASVGSTTLTIHTEIFHPFIEALFFEGNYNLFFFFFIIVSLVSSWKIWKGKQWIDGLFFMAFLGSFSIFFVVFLCTFNYTEVLSQTGVNRSMIQIIPVGLFFMIVSLYRLIANK